MRGDGLRGGRGSRGGRIRRGGIRSYQTFHNPNYNFDKRNDFHGSGDDEPHSKEHNERYSRLKDVGSRSFVEDSRISKQLRRIAREENAERYVESIKQLQESILLADNIKYVRRNCDHILDYLFEYLLSAPNRSCKWEVAQCIGNVGHIMDNDVDRFVENSFNRLEMGKQSELKVLILRGFYHLVSLDVDGHQVLQVGDYLVEGLHSVLEETEVVEVMVATVDILRKIHLLSPSVLSPFFQDLVDILVGWHIDFSQSKDVINYVSLSLQSFTELWRHHVPFANTLLSQFVEDMEDYMEEPSVDNEEKSDDEGGSLGSTSNSRKVSSFISVFTTILRCLGDQAEPSINTRLPSQFYIKSLRKMMRGTNKNFDQHSEESMLHALNQLCLVLVIFKLEGLLDEILELLKMHNNYIERMNYTTQLSYLSLASTTINQYGSCLTVDFIQSMMNESSSLRKLQMSPNQPVWKSTLKVYHSIFALKNIPLLQEAYKYILIDMQVALNSLCPSAKPIAPFLSNDEEKPKMDTKLAAVQMSYYVLILAEVANTRNSIITMWALSPSLVELLATHLQVSSVHFASHHPQVQLTILSLLYSHSTKHSHYISSSLMVVGTSPSFVSPSIGGFPADSTSFSSVSSTSENLSTILNTITAVLQLKKVGSAPVLCLCVKWATEILIGCESSLLQLLKKKPFKDLLSAVVDLGYHFLQSVSHCVVKSLSNILEVLPFNQLHCIEDIVQLCLCHSSHRNEEINRHYSDLLAILPLSVIVSSISGIKGLAKNEYSSNKSDNFDAIEVGNVDSKTIISLQRHFLLHSTTQIPATAFYSIINFILNGVQPEEDRWLEDLWAVNQRVDQLSKPEDWSFSILAPQLKILLWKWMVWEAAQHCIANKLKTTLGKPYDTFTCIESAIKRHAKEVRECGLPSPATEDLPLPVIPFKTKIRNIPLLVEFVESLEKAMFNASDGCAVAPHLSNKSVKIFFTTNRQTCLEWLTRIRAAMIIVSLNSGQPYIALRQSYKLLNELVESNNTKGGDFERALCYCVKALIVVGCESGVIGLYFWAKVKTGREFSWIKAAAHCAGKKYECALLELIKWESENEVNGVESVDEINEDSNIPNQSSTVENPNLPADPFVQEFIKFQITECYSKLNQWEDLIKFAETLNEKQAAENSPPNNGDLNFLQDIKHIEALSHFENGNMEGILNSLSDFQSNNDPNGWPLWKRNQNVHSSLLLVFTSTLYPQEGNSECLDELLNVCRNDQETILELSLLNPHYPTQINALFNLQVIRQLSSIRKLKFEDLHFHEHWESFSFDSYDFDTLHQISRWTKLLGTINQNITEASKTKLDLLSVKYARKCENYQFAERSLIKLFRNKKSSSLLQAIQEFPSESEFTVLTSKLYKEAGKMLACSGKVIEGCDVLASVVVNLNPVLATLASQDPSLLSLPPNEAGHLCARSILTLNKWWNNKEKREIILPHEFTSPPLWMEKTMKVYQKMKNYIPEELDTLKDISPSYLPLLDGNMGCLLSLAAIQCPNLPKVWYHVASWSFKWGCQILNKFEVTDSTLLFKEDLEAIRNTLAIIVLDDSLDIKMDEVVTLLGTSRRRKEDDQAEGDLRLEEVEGSQHLGAALSHMFLEWGIKSSSSSIVISTLLDIRCSAMKRNHSLLITSAKAYFKFLKIGHTVSSSPSDQQMIATLRLLRLIVKHASELQDVLEKGLSETPTAPWRAIIPQLFARLNHPEPYVRSSISELLCRLARDCPHLIIFPAVVGSSGTMSSGKQASFTNMFDKYFQKKKKKKMESLSSGEDEEEEEEEADEDDDEEVEEEKEDREEDEEDDIDANKDDEKRTLMRNCFSTLVNTLKKQVGGSIAEVQTLIHELRRITVLWDELWLGTLSQHLSDFARKCHQLKNDISRLHKNASLSSEEKEQLIHKKYEIVFQPIVFVLDQLTEITSSAPETPHETNFQEVFQSVIKEARESLVSPADIQEPSEALVKLRHLHQMLQQKAQRRSSLKMAEISPVLAKMTSTEIAMPGVNSPSNEIVSIASVGSSILILPTKTKPKKLSFQGSDGKRYTYLFKGLEDLHLDQRIMQFLATVNTMLSKNHKIEDSTYRAHYYSVVPLGARSGLIQWVGNATPLFGLYKRWQQREAQIQALKLHSTQTPGAPPQITTISRPSDLYYSKLSPRLKEAGVSLDSRKEWPIHILRDVFQELVKETPKDLLSRELWQTSVNASEWWKITRMYNVSTAVMSIIGYVIGLGDRHLDNLLVNLTTGEMVHIDYNVCFEKGKNLRVPEKVPYRMTQNIEAALGVTGVEGMFRSACEHVLRSMRKGRETLLTLLEAFVYDPLVDWTPESDAGYAGAVYGGDQTLVLEARQNRQELERGLTITMFTVRLAEMKADWLENKENVIEAIPTIMSSLDTWQTTHQALAEAESNLQEGHHLMAMIKEAEANPQHSLYELLSRNQEYTIVKKSIQGANKFLLAKMNELKNCQNQYKMADKLFKGGQINDLRSKLVHIGPLVSSIAPVKEYLKNAGQVQLGTQCEHNEVELSHSLAQLVSVSITALERLAKYGSVWVNYPSDHIEKHRICKHLSYLNSLYQDLTLDNVQRVIAQSHKDMSEDQNLEIEIGNIDVYFHSKSHQLNVQLQKIYENVQEEGLTNSTTILSTYEECLKAVTTLALEQGEVGTSAVTCALLNSLSQSLSIRLREDKAVASMGDSLSDMMIGNLWWYNESMVSLGCIWKLISLINQHSPPSSPTEVAVFKSINVLQDVFTAIQDLILNTSHIIVVEGGRLLFQREPSVLNIATRLQEIVTNSFVPIPTLCQQLTHHLHMTIFRMPSMYESAVQEANKLHTQLVNLIQQMTDTSFSAEDNRGSEMSQGQMLLMGFHLLFETVDNQLDRLIEALSAAPLPHPWPRVDMIRLSSEIMGPVFDPSLREVIRAILRVKKVQAITSFFSQALQMFSDPNRKINQGISSSEEEQLTRIVRGYAGECIFRLLLGLPSYLSTHLILIYSQKLGVDVTGYIESHDVGTEGRVPLEGLVEDALEKCITQKSLQSVIATAASTVTSYMTAARQQLLLKQWENEVEGVKLLLQRVSSQHLSHHWFYEERLKQSVVNLQLLPNRSITVSEIRKLESTLAALHQNVNEFKEKFLNFTGNVMHRLKWASASNPNIAAALDEFSQSVEAGNATVNKVVRASEEVRSLCNGICHYEILKSTGVEALTEDNQFNAVLNKTQESCMVVQRYTGAISSQEELLITLCPLPDEITPGWVRMCATAVSDHLESLTNVVGENKQTLKVTEESIHSSVDHLRLHLTIHHKLMSDVRVLLKSLAKFEQERGVQGVDGYFRLYKRYSEIMSGIVRQLLHEPLSPEKIVLHNQKFQQLLQQTYVIYDKLVDFGHQCVTDNETQPSESKETLTSIPFSLKDQSLFSSPRKVPMTEIRAKRHPVTGKVIQEHNVYALNVWKRVKAKLEGKDGGTSQILTVADQVDVTIKEACNVNNLATLYEGWTAWV